jgi:hemerythrin
MKAEINKDIILGVKSMDEQHMKLVSLLNETLELLKDGRREDAIILFHKNILDYVEKHFLDEEEFMKSINYPELEEHKKIHNIFSREIYNLAKYMEKGDVKSFRNAVSLSWGWLYNHITKTDRKYAKWAKENGYLIDLG